MMQFLRRLDAAMGRIYEAIGVAVSLSIGLFALAIVIDLAFRLAGWGNLAGMQEIIEYLLFAGVFLTAPWLLRMGAHVRVDLILSALPKHVLVWVERAVDLLGVVVCLAMVWYGAANRSSAWSFGSMQMKYFNVPEWWLLSVVVVAFTLLTLEFALRFVRTADADPHAAPEHGV
jgi:TRAP-type C4-dicarboxylate transport system permease small subunit